MKIVPVHARYRPRGEENRREPGRNRSGVGVAVGLDAAASADALAGGVVDRDVGLQVVAVHVEADARAVVLHGRGFHMDPARHELVVLEDGPHAVDHVVARLLDITCDPLLKRQHALFVQVARTGDEVALVGVLA